MADTVDTVPKPAKPLTRPRRKTRVFQVGARQESATKRFWIFAEDQSEQTDAVRLTRIQAGLEPEVTQMLREAFQLNQKGLEILLGISGSTIVRRKRSGKPLDATTSEKLDRIAEVTHLADEVFADREAAIDWMRRKHPALGNDSPIMLCGTELGANQVRRVLNALEWGGVV
ncbi:DUF2384 domain-containing protein [Halomonas sp. McH1-25]|uniref:type II RES/Xre toxin-antitoxin system antitoxin n=1 Tax=unclassified Halomonas TaxID=2609666 RepID=UPI001EF60C14|nr:MULTISPECIES: antitoxin Xre/MbcA/ParS toxin-binding domain-containing protein [unclassified Halomonas]MCG7602045.1 DUF2384 domain-containing protein [Halomonas sp. McH1-25]MCP1342881.1 DUF2384 domain-containing protein [Halomonas sp. FL8]MCP1361680.1 DUF2384 domain-containing protein [Halomonas sp. BBD45]MCP1363623.1 DUF2384 domain-containing protein [Halomonas sp. BBD48]